MAPNEMSVAFRATRAALARSKAVEERRSSRTEPPGWAWRVFERSVTLSEAYGELEHIVAELTRSAWFRHIRVLLKMYAIGWMTLSDVVANLINEALGLGYHEKDVEFGAILRNEHAVRAGLPALVKRHAKLLRHEHYSRIRNDVVHRGRLSEPALEEVEKMWSTLVLEKAFEDIRRTRNPEEAAEAANADPTLHSAIRTFVATKAADLTIHLAATRTFLIELDELLAHVIDLRP